MVHKSSTGEKTSLKIAQIGVGYWGPNLLRNLIANKRCQVLRVVDASPERRSYVNGLYPSVLTSANSNDIFDDPGINAVVIATPVATHYDLAIKALNAGKHILVEKPLARSVAEVILRQAFFDALSPRLQLASRFENLLAVLTLHSPHVLIGDWNHVSAIRALELHLHHDLASYLQQHLPVSEDLQQVSSRHCLIRARQSLLHIA